MKCDECPSPIRRGRFCCNECRDAWNNRIRIRGVTLVQLFMVHRFDRKVARATGVLDAMSKFATRWRDEDLKAGRASWGDWKRIVENF